MSNCLILIAKSITLFNKKVTVKSFFAAKRASSVLQSSLIEMTQLQANSETNKELTSRIAKIIFKNSQFKG